MDAISNHFIYSFRQRNVRLVIPNGRFRDKAYRQYGAKQIWCPVPQENIEVGRNG